MTREEWKQVERSLQLPDIQTAMRGRCEEQGHQMENGLTAVFRLVEICKWCGYRRYR
jgi:hypothetical protein